MKVVFCLNKCCVLSVTSFFIVLDHHASEKQESRPHYEIISDMLMEATENEDEKTDVSDSEDAEARSQTFFPSFSPFGHQPLGHSRPFFFQQEGAYSQRPSTYQQQLSFDVPKFGGFKDEVFKSRAAPSEKKETRGLLGSGNFGVISGGTFYADNDKEGTSYGGGSDSDDFSSYYSNGHGRPSFYFGGASNPKPQKHEQQFANFRDFADINTPASPAFSHFVVVYVNKNGTIVEPPPVKQQIAKPKNIIESLALLDLEPVTSTTTSEAPPTKKMSKSKRKLALLPPEKKKKIKKSGVNKKETAASEQKHLNEPLLALS